MKSIYDMDIDELEKRKKLLAKINWFYLFLGTIYVLGSMYFYYKTYIIGPSLMLFITGMFVILLSCLPNNVKLLIYLKKHGM
jgi:hypothetical protein